MVKFASKIFLFCLVLILSFNLYAFDFRANKYENMQAPEFSLQDLSDKFVSLKDFQGKPVILFFWTTWCPHCLRQIQILNEEYNNIKSLGMELLAVDINEPKSRIKQFVDKYSITYPVLLDSDGFVASKYDIIGVPALVLVSKEGEIISVTNNLPYNYKEILSQ